MRKKNYTFKIPKSIWVGLKTSTNGRLFMAWGCPHSVIDQGWPLCILKIIMMATIAIMMLATMTMTKISI
jgi:hypothetical protein